VKQFLVFCLSLATLGALPSAAATYEDIKEVEKIALALTGKPLSQEMIERFVAGEITAADVFENLSKSDDFVDHFAKFWSGILGIRSVQSLGSLRIEGTERTVFNQLAPLTNANLRKDELDPVKLPPNDPATVYENRRVAIAANATMNDRYRNWVGPQRLVFQRCGAEIWIRSVYLNAASVADAESVIANNTYPDGAPVSLPKIRDFPGLTGAALAAARLERSRAVYADALNLHQQITPSCTDTTRVSPVTPFWDRAGSIKYKVATYLMHDNRCKADLSGCFSDLTTFPYLRAIDEDSTLEPGRIIGMTVAEDLDFKSILTTTKTVVTGRLAHFLENRLPADVWNLNFPGGKYTDQTARFKAADIDGAHLYWIERGDEHAGVLTTPTFHLITNGRRAKANRAFEAFACSKFAVPEGAVPDPDDANPDLRQRKYCAYCHRTLEPMAAFFNRYPETGRVNFEFDDSDAVNDSGVFRGDSGEGVIDYGKLLAKSGSFDQCAIRRAFEFVHGRELTQSEATVLVPKYLEVYRSGNNLRQVLKSMVFSRQFAGDKSAGDAP
jgi:hypothetical protein